MMWIIYAIFCLTTTFLIALIYSDFYWRRKGVPYKVYFPYIDGTCALALKQNDVGGYFNDTLCRNFPKSRYFGTYFFGKPILSIHDADLIREMFVKNFDHFVDQIGFINFENEPLWSKNLFNLKGQAWKDMRGILSPSFTGSQMKKMFLLVDQCAKNYVDVFSNEPYDVIDVELRDVCKRFSIDVIANTAYGIEINSLIDKNNEFFVNCENLNDFTGFLTIMKFILIKLSPKLATFLDVKLINPKHASFFTNVIKNSIEYRQKHNVQRNDMIQLLLNAKENKNEAIDVNDIVSQAFVFFAGGSNTLASSMHFLAYNLATNPDVQEKLRQEIKHSKLDNEVSYELIMNLPYMDMVVSESLRLFPVFYASGRVCTKNFQIKPTNSKEKPVDLKVGDDLLIPLYGLHMDPKYFPNPKKFDPERFLAKNLKNTAPYFPFGLGPRMCIAYRFALMLMKTFTFRLLLDFEIVPTKRTVPMTLLKGAMKLESAEELWFGFKKREF